MPRVVPVLAGLMLALATTGCTSLGYYAHLARGQLQLLAAREPISALLAEGSIDPALRHQLALALEARAFASDQLGLPRNRSYTLYADLHRPWVVRNVFATPEFSTRAITHCFPIAGCVGYRGYYDEVRAKAEVERLRAQGLDVYLGSSPAYSTLGWFDDPVLNTMLPRTDHPDDDTLAGTIFHELAHQQLYVEDDTSFNESFASFVEQQGLSEWRRARGTAQTEPPAMRRADRLAELMLASRARLDGIYASGLAPQAMRAAKQAEFERLRSEYRALRDGEWQGYAGYDAFMNAELNNARLLPFGLYHHWLPAFAALFAREGRDWGAFYKAAKRLAGLPAEARSRTLQQLDDSSASAKP